MRHGGTWYGACISDEAGFVTREPSSRPTSRRNHMGQEMGVLKAGVLGAVLALWLVPATAWAQATSTGALAQLSPGGQKIVEALYQAESPKTLTQEQIAELRQGHKGWGQVFKAMKAQGLLTQKNLGQVVRSFERRDPEAAKLAKAELAKAEKSERPEKPARDRKSTRLNSSHSQISYAVFCLKKKRRDALR